MLKNLNDAIKIFNDFIKISIDFFKYQIMSKFILSFFILPLFWFIVNNLLLLNGKNAITNQQIIKFIFFTPEGIIIFMFYSCLVAFGIILEISGFIIISVLSTQNKTASFFNICIYNLKKYPKFLGLGGLFISTFLLLVTPFSFKMILPSFLNWIKLPNFISSEVYENTNYLLIYFILFLISSTLTILYIFIFHFVTLTDLNIYESLKASRKLIINNFKYIFKSSLSWHIILFAIINVSYFYIFKLISFFINFISFKFIYLAFAIISLNQILYFVFQTLLIPLEVYLITLLFLHLTEKDNINIKIPIIKEKFAPNMIDKLLSNKKSVLIILSLTILIPTIPMNKLFTEIIDELSTPNIYVIAHRSFGNLAPENSIPALYKAIDYKADFTEIDVQRTKDNKYILNHDNTFKRVANINKKSKDMTLNEIKKINIGSGEFEGTKIPTAYEYLYNSKGKIKTFLELKGETADKKMADDMIKLVKFLNMEDDVVFISLNYNLINYIETKFPNLHTGLIYFVSLGEPSLLNCDYLILEEFEATKKNIQKIHKSGKKTIVWTVNSEKSMKNFIASDVDGIITDNVPLLQNLFIKFKSPKNIFKTFINSEDIKKWLK